MNKLGTILILLLFASCASMDNSLSGGEKDVTPPKIKSSFPDSAQLNFEGKTVTFHFDEYVSGNSINKNIIISPKPSVAPEIKLSSNKLNIQFKEDLLPNTTYTINLNNAIKDYNEGNMLQAFKFIFSTGNFIDSNAVSFFVKDAYSNSPCAECLVGLYSDKNDSAILNSKPIYIGYTNESGNVSITNLPDTSFRTIALKDDNQNLVLDYDESASFFSTTNYNQKDTLIVFPYTNQIVKKPTLVRSSNPFKTTLISDLPIAETKIQLEANSKLIPHTISKTRDTISAYHASNNDSVFLNLRIGTDTFEYIRKVKSLKHKLRFENVQLTNDQLVISFNSLIGKIDTSLIELFLDSIQVYDYTYSLKENILIIAPSKPLSRPVDIKLKSSSVFDLDSNNIDSLGVSIPKIEENLPDLTLEISSSNSMSYIINLISKDKVIASSIVNSDTTIHFNNLDPLSYKVQWIKDTNQNGIWDSGNIFLKKQPEEVYYSELFEIRMNWDKSLKINL